ncbi:MAG TPA: site-2 protease family protein [Rhizobiaceae bacterium]|nr:site-2 protease family protein [Rhizobiaceae bacterium]
MLIEDALTGGFMETDRATASFARLLDGRHTPEAAYKRLLRDFPDAPLQEAEIPFLLEELQRQGMLEESEAGPPRLMPGRRLGPVSQRIRLGAWNSVFGWLAGHLHWLYGPLGLIGWLALIIVAGGQLWAQWPVFRSEIGSLFTLNAILWFWLAWLVSKAWHECQHGIVARLYGVDVREIGVLFILFVPLGAYVDVTGVWRLENKWQRLHITAAGIIGEIALGAAAILLWSRAEPGEWRTFLQALAVATTLSTVVFNANPLMRYDGYYALVDLLGIPNLYQRGLGAIRTSVVRWLTGTGIGQRESMTVRVYGLCAALWRILLALSLTVVAARLAFGFGLLLGIFVLWGLLVAPLVRVSKIVWRLGIEARRKALLHVAGVAAALGALWFMPIPTWISAPGVVQYHDSLSVRAESAGEVTHINVHEGSLVRAGETVALLQNKALAAEFQRLTARRDLARLELSDARFQNDPTGAENAAGELNAAEQELAEAKERMDKLTVVAPRGGMILDKDLPSRKGAWIKRGGEIVEIGDRAQLEIQAWLLPSEARLLKSTDMELTFRQADFGATRGAVILERLEPVASRKLPPLQVTAEGGGPLAVDVREKEHQLVDARFLAIFKPAGVVEGWYPGMPGKLVSRFKWTTVGARIRDWADRIDFRDPAHWKVRRW